MTEIDRAITWFERRKAGGTTPGTRKMYDVALAAIREQQEREQNGPMTLEILCLPQLRQMEGERVMVMRMGVMTQAEPAIVKRDGHCVSDSGCLCYAELYGKTWIAYRRPPEQ